MGSKTVVKSTPPPTPKQYMPKAPPAITRRAIEADKELDAGKNRLLNQKARAGLMADSTPKFTGSESVKEKAKKIKEAKKFKPKKVNKVGYGSIMADSTVFKNNKSSLGY